MPKFSTDNIQSFINKIAGLNGNLIFILNAGCLIFIHQIDLGYLSQIRVNTLVMTTAIHWNDL